MNKEKVGNLIEKFDCDQSHLLNNLAAVLQEQYANVTNGFLSEIFEFLFGEELEFEGEVKNLHMCPCCKYKTLDEIYDLDLGTGYDICPICKWEDDGTKIIDAKSAINKGSISEYRKKMTENSNFYYREKYEKK